MKIQLGDHTHIDLQRLVVTRMLLQANSGGGKSWALRRILEQSHGHVQQLVIDIDDEFYTLREKYDYILVRKDGGDCVPEVRSAGLLAHRLLELGVSAIISIYEMKHHERIAFVKAFLDALVNAPKKLWHPALVVVDEAHVFCPEKDKAESAGSVIDLMTRGRKRGFCGILATQRISKLAKDAAAETNNKLIGRAALDVDMKRGADEIGFTTREDQHSLRQLKPGEFFAFGPAISDTIVRVKVGGVSTTHPKAGAGVTPIAPPKTKVKSVLAQLADLPQEAAEEHATVASLKQSVRALTAELAAAVKAQPKAKIEQREILVVKDAQLKRAESLFDKIAKYRATEIKRSDEMVGKFSLMMSELSTAIAKANGPRADGIQGNFTQKPVLKPNLMPNVRETSPNKSQLIPRKPAETDGASPGENSPGGGLRRIMVALAQRPNGLSQRQIGVFAGLSSKGGTFSTYLSRARSNGWIEGERDLVRITPAGIEALGAFEMLPTGELLYQHWLAKLGNGGAARILTALHDVYPNELTKEEIAERASISAAGGSFSTYLSRLRSLELITGNKSIQASAELFES